VERNWQRAEKVTRILENTAEEDTELSFLMLKGKDTKDQIKDLITCQP